MILSQEEVAHLIDSALTPFHRIVLIGILHASNVKIRLLRVTCEMHRSTENIRIAR
jgi:hypothetical protein